MQVSVKYFASLRELMGEAGTDIVVADDTSISELWQSITSDRDIVIDNVMMAVNMEYVSPDHKLKAGDEVAFFLR